MERISSLIDSLAVKLPFHGEYLRSSIQRMTDEEKRSFERLLAFYMNAGHTIESLTRDYSRFFKDVMKERAYFQKHHQYRHHTLAEVADSIYHDPNYMDMYMIGLSLSIYVWEEAFEIHRWFIQQIRGRTGQRYLEVGPGHGENFVKAMELSHYESYEALDLSQTSLDATRAYAQYALPDKDNISYTLGDFLQYSNTRRYDAMIIGEVLEHVERPDAFLKQVCALADKDTFIYISTAINSPAIDHIYQFHNQEEVFQLVRENGLVVMDYCYVPTIESVDAEDYPSADLGMVLRCETEGVLL